MPRAPKSTPTPGMALVPGDQVGQRAVVWREGRDGLVVGGAGGQELAELLADQAVHELVDAVAQDLGPEDLVPAVLTNATTMTSRIRGRSGRSTPMSRRKRAAEVLGLLGRHHHPGHRAAGPGPPIGPRRRAARPPDAACRRLPPPIGPLMPLPPG